MHFQELFKNTQFPTFPKLSADFLYLPLIFNVIAIQVTCEINKQFYQVKIEH